MPMTQLDRGQLPKIPVVILCGGFGVRLGEDGARTNKALVKVDGTEMLLRVMQHYADAGFRTFVIAAGFQHREIKALLERSLDTHLSDPTMWASGRLGDADVRVAVVDTGEAAKTGDRLVAVRGLVERAPWFAVAYSDTLSDVDLRAVAATHLQCGGIATLVAAQMPTRFRVLGVRWGERRVRGFAPKPIMKNDPINGGYYVFSSAIFGERYLGMQDNGVVLEDEVVNRLVEDGQLFAYFHEGVWQNLDNERDLAALTAICSRRS